MTALWTAAEAATATGGRVVGNWTALGVSIDTRTLERGDLFVALDGENRDGHQFATTALDRGAAAVLIQRPTEGLSPSAPQLVVPHTLRALEALGIVGRARCSAKIVGVTGSVGKTGTKEALRHVLAAHGRTHASVASYNNHWGVPLSLARMPRDTELAVFEMGMNHAGEITPLSRIARPHVAIITWVTSAHLEFFASEAAIADAKAEIMNGLEPGGVVILPRDNPHFVRLQDHARRLGIGKVVTFGAAVDADWRLVDATLGPDSSEIVFEHQGRRLDVRLGAPGRHWAMNALAVLAATEALGFDPRDAAVALGGFSPPSGRGQRQTLAVPGGTAVLIDESYNGNPASMLAAIEVLGRQPGRRVLALGDMRELGPSGPSLHEELAQPVVDCGARILLTCGPLMRHLHDAVRGRIETVHCEDVAEIQRAIRRALRPGDVLLVKGSLSTGMNKMVKELLAQPATIEKVG